MPPPIRSRRSSLPHPRTGRVVLPSLGSALLSRYDTVAGRIGLMTTIALITAANKGIGFETARLLAAPGLAFFAGARDEAPGREAERAPPAGGADARFVQLDFTDH